MVFSSILFLFIYLPVVLLIYFMTPLKFRNLMLLIANLIFYGWGEPVYILIMVLSTLVDYTHGMLVDRYRENDKLAKRFVISSVVFNVAILGFFKYYDFFVRNLALLIPHFPLTPLGLPLPIGISFYTFQTMSYTIDVYRNEAPVQKNILDFGTYVTLFPQLIAGPIVRYKDVAKELTDRETDMDKFASGVYLFLIGLGKKVLLANNIGMLWDVYKGTPTAELTVLGAWLGIIAFGFQIYFDFSGYSDMARGLGRMFGFEFLMNFNYPYISKSITEFWRRWHISLGTWFREYVYIPMGGNRRGPFRTYFNICLVWFLTGFWHGANYNFILWGMYFAVLLILEKNFLLKLLQKIPAFFQHLYLMALVEIGWVFFAIEDAAHGIGYIKALFGLEGMGLYDTNFLYYLGNYGFVLLVLAIASTPLAKNLFEKIPEKAKPACTVLFVILMLITTTAYLVDASYNPFLYFRF